MGISIGQQLGSYEITALLGKGGMGEVYRAKDTKLKRDVAIKILPDEFSRDPERVSRFQREAEALAALNHQNIGAIYDLQQVDTTRFLILELVEGDTLADLLVKRGALPVEEALNIAQQICEALEAAHEKGIVHRDLKPANVKITPEGNVKVLDFGLAKAMDSGPATAGLSNSPTLTMAGTNAGVIIGTAAYMSPEQARGRAADQRSDVFAFGCVLYEMLTGHPAFSGDEVSDVLASVLARESDMSLLPRNLNSRIPDLLRRCLDKERKRRWYAIGDLRLEMEAIAEAPYAPPIPAAQAVKPRPLWVPAILALAGAIVFSAIASIATWNLKRPGPANILRFPLVLPEGQILTSVGRHMLALSPDGTRLVYAANTQLFLRFLAEMEIRSIIGTNTVAQSPFFSPDGQWIGFYSGQDATLKKIAVTGGAALTLCKADNFFSGSWDGDVIVFAQGGRGIMRVSANGGDPEVLAAIKPSEVVDSPQLINGGRSLLFTLATEQGSDRWDKAQTIVQSLNSGERKVVLRGGSDARYLPTGHLVYALGGTLLAVPFDVTKGEVQGGPVPILEGVMRSLIPATGSAAAHFAFSSSGSLIYVPGPPLPTASQQTLGFADLNGKVHALGLPPQAYMYPRISPDGKQLAVATDDGKEGIVWIYDLKGGNSLRRLTFGGRNLFPIWTPDSRYITFQSDREGDRGLFKQAADGSGSAERLIKADQGAAYEPEAWSPDGKILAFDAGRPDDAIWTLSPGELKTNVLVDVPKSNQRYAAFSPDGRWFAYASNELSQRGEVFVQPFPPNGAKYQISMEGGRAPVWSRDGKQIFYQPAPLGNNTTGLFAVDVRTQPTFTFGKPMPLPIDGIMLPAPPTHRNFDITPDGKQFIVVQASKSQNDTNQRSVPQINVVVNWFSELQQRVPVK